MKNQLLRLYARNRGRGTFRAEAAGEEATIYLYDVIVDSEIEAEWWGGVAPTAFIRELHAAVDKASTVHLRINCPGGSVFGARAMEQAIREARAKATIVAHIDGYAASAASFLMLAADEVVIAPGAMVMVHKSWAIALGNADDMREMSDLLDKIDGTLADTYAKRTGKDRAVCLDWMAEETWFTAQEAVDAGLADAIAEEPKAKAAALGQFDVSAYRKAPAGAVTPALQHGPQVVDFEPEDEQAWRERRAEIVEVIGA